MSKFILLTIAAVVLVGCGPSIHQVVIDGNIALIRRELSNGANVNQKNEDGFTLLHLAVKSGHETIVRLLISKGAVVNAKDTRGFTSLDYSTELNEMFSEDEKIPGITTTQIMMVRNEDGSVKEVTMNNAKIKKNRVILDLLRKHGGKTSDELDAAGN